LGSQQQGLPADRRSVVCQGIDGPAAMTISCHPQESARRIVHEFFAIIQRAQPVQPTA
jgi:hypothetical protein